MSSEVTATHTRKEAIASTFCDRATMAMASAPITSRAGLVRVRNKELLTVYPVICDGFLPGG